jgi:ribosomal protein L33
MFKDSLIKQLHVFAYSCYYWHKNMYNSIKNRRMDTNNVSLQSSDTEASKDTLFVSIQRFLIELWMLKDSNNQQLHVLAYSCYCWHKNMYKTIKNRRMDTNNVSIQRSDTDSSKDTLFVSIRRLLIELCMFEDSNNQQLQ